jgi:Phage terminase large subunit (GpA)
MSLNLLLWAKQNVRKIDGKLFSFKNYPFLVEIYETDFDEAVIQKCAQIGATVLAILWFIHKVGVQGRNGIYYFPNDTAISAFVQSRFNPMLRENENLGTMVRDTDNTRVKRIGSTFGHFLGLTGKTQKLSTPADVLVFDELDAAPGSKDVEIAEERTGASENVSNLYLSTPTFPNFGINKKFLLTDQRHRMMKCPHCGEWSCPPTGNPTPESNELRFPECVEPGYLACRKCGLALDVYQSQWVPKYPSKFSGKKPGWHISRLISPIWSRKIPVLLDRFRRAQNIQNFYNSFLGLPYADGENMVTREHVLSLCGNYPNYNGLDSAWSCTAGVDVGKVLHVCISRKSTIPGKIREYVFIGTIGGVGMSKFDELGRLFNRFRIRKFVIDGMPETSAVEDFLEKFKFKGFACFYKETKLLMKWTNPGHKERKNNLDIIAKVGKYEVNRTEHLDASQKYLFNKQVVFPRQGINMEEFADHCVAIARMEVIDETTGDKKNVWVQNESERDDYRHAFGYDVACWDDRTVNAPTGNLVVPKDIDKAGRHL